VEALCSTAEPPTCCDPVNPYCGFGLHRDPVTKQPEPAARTLNPLCDKGPQEASACCGSDSISVPSTFAAAALSGEWIVSYGQLVK
jgi:hypothetical protein